MGRRSIGARALTTLLIGLVTATAAGAVQAPPSGGRRDRLAGTWQGVLEVSAIELRLVLRLEVGDDGAFTGTLDSPDQGAAGIPLSAVTIEGDRVRLASAAIAGEMVGRLTPDGRIEGVWKQAGNELPLTLTRSRTPPEPARRPQEPSTEVPYRVEEVAFDSLDPGVRLAGTLTLPEGEGPFPGVVLLSGSGPQDRDEALMGHRPFAVLADHLTRQGVAVLRYDDRGVGGSTGDFSTATTESFAADAEAGHRWLGERPETGEDEVGLLGHSEGATVAAKVAAREPSVAFLVLVAPPAVPGDALLLGQIERTTRAAGGNDAQAAAAVDLQRRIHDVLLADLSEDERADRLDAILAGGLATLPEAERASAAAALDFQRRQLLAPWFRGFLRHDSATDLSRVTAPVLAIWGDKDVQVPPAQNRPPLEAALAAAGNRRVTARTLPGLNHLLQTAETGLPTEYARLEETIAPTALELIADWIAESAKTSGRVGAQLATSCAGGPQVRPSQWPLRCAHFPLGGEEVADCARRAADGEVVVRPGVLPPSNEPGRVHALVVDGELLFTLPSGKTAPALLYDNGPDYFVEGRARTIRDGKIGFVDEQLDVVVPRRWDFAFPFDGGFARVCLGCWISHDRGAEHGEVRGGMWGLIDRDGRVVVPVEYERESVPSRF